MTQRTNDPAWSAAPLDGADPERLAALLDGRLSGAERDELLARLADQDEDLALFAEAAAIQRELEAEDGVGADTPVHASAADAEPADAEPGVIPLRRPEAARRGVDRRWLAVAAVVAGIALVPLAWRASQGGGVREPAQAVAMLGNSSAGLPVGWNDNRPWSNTRGGADGLSDEARAARVGAWIVNLELAVRTRDAEATRQLVATIAAALTEANASGTYAASQFQALADRAGADPAELLPALHDASDAAADAVDEDRFALGAWAEAARFAAAGRDVAFFRDARTGRTLSEAEELVGDDEQAGPALAAIRAALGAESTQWPELETGTNNLLGALGS